LALLVPYKEYVAACNLLNRPYASSATDAGNLCHMLQYVGTRGLSNLTQRSPSQNREREKERKVDLIERGLKLSDIQNREEGNL
jgi:hypothetical protein